MRSEETHGESGFSLAELMVAMVITLIISGSIFGLLTAGGKAFRREPERTEMQQNVRMAMNIVLRDVSIVGSGMGNYFQTFTRGLDGAGPVGPFGNSDFLEMFGNDGTCPDLACRQNGANLDCAGQGIPACYSENTFVMVLYNDPNLPGPAKPGFGFNIHSQSDKINFPPGQQPPPPASLVLNPNDLNNATGMGRLQFVRYEIATAAGDLVPSLWRSATGGFSAADGTGYQSAAAANNDPNRWQVVARGIEDMQVQYQTDAGWSDDAPAVLNMTPDSIIKAVRVTFGGRAEGRVLIEGQTAGVGGQAIRTQLTSVGVPRAAVVSKQSFNMENVCGPSNNLTCKGDPRAWR